MFLEKEVTKYIVKHNIGIICMRDDHNYYLSKLTFTKQKNLKGMITTMRCLHLKMLSPALTWIS